MADLEPPEPSHRVVGTIFKKELVETLRDRRTLALMFLLPLVVYPFLVVLGSETASISQGRMAAQPTVVLASAGLPAEVTTALTQGEHLVVRNSSTTFSAREDEDELIRTQLRQGQLDAVITASVAGLAERADLTNLHLQVYVDRTSDRSELAEQRISAALAPLEKALGSARLRALGVSPQSLEPLRLTVKTVSSRAEMGAKILARLLPMLVLFFVALSLFYPAVDLTAGEKERGTLATLLVTPVRPLDIVLGKYLAVVAIGSLAAALNVVVIGSTLLRVLASADVPLGLDLPALTLRTFGGLLLGGVLLATSVGAVMLLIASLARSFRDANTLMTPVLLLILVPPTLLLSLPGAAASGSASWVPVLGAVTLQKDALEGTLQLSSVLLAIIGHGLFSAVTIGLTARLFADERALFSEDGARADWKNLLFDPPPLGPAAALAFVAWLFAGNYFLGALIRPGAALLGVAVVQVSVQLVPALLFAAWLSRGLRPGGPPWTSLLRLGRSPSSVEWPRALGAGVLVGLGVGLAVALPLTWLQSLWLHAPPEAAGLAERLDLASKAWPLLVLVLALLPAVAEELAFRGIVLTLFERRLSKLAAILFQAVLFGLLHGSLFRLLPTAALGLVLGLLAVRTRWLLPGLVAHATHNALVVIVARYWPDTASALERPTIWALAAWLPLILAGLLVWAPRGALRPTATQSGST